PPDDSVRRSHGNGSSTGTPPSLLRQTGGGVFRSRCRSQHQPEGFPAKTLVPHGDAPDQREVGTAGEPVSFARCRPTLSRNAAGHRRRAGVRNRRGPILGAKSGASSFGGIRLEEDQSGIL